MRKGVRETVKGRQELTLGGELHFGASLPLVTGNPYELRRP